MNVFDLFAKLSLDTSEYEKGLGDAEKQAGGMGKKLAKGFGVVAKVTTAAIGAASTAIGVVTKQSVEGYAEYEQMVGGIKKLYGNMGMTLEEYAESMKDYAYTPEEIKTRWKALEDAQNTVLNNAKNAFKTAGMSANQYMDIATSFSAALISDLDDTQAAAEMTDIAMKAISDNWNTFGGDLGMIQGAFQGFAKQNYTMLDNLKLGYGGTKTEMERLIEDANAYAEANGRAADLSIDSFADIVDAIQLIQEKQNIAGTTAREATTTISGSLGMLKAAWKNLVVGFSDGDADIGQLMDNVLVSIVGTTDEAGNHINGFADNIIPVITKALTSIGGAVEQLAPIIADQLPILVEQLLPPLINAGVSLVNGLIAALPAILNVLIGIAPQVISTLSSTFMDMAPQLIELGVQMLVSLVEGLADGLPQAIPMIVDCVMQIAEVLLDNADKLIDAGIDLLIALVQGFINAEPQFLEKMPELLLKLARALISGAGKLISAIIEITGMMIKNFVSSIPEYAKAAGQIIDVIVQTLIGAVATLIKAGVQLVQGIWQGISSATQWLKSKITGWVGNVVDFLKNLFGIHSPSTVMRDVIGKNLALGLWQGWDKNDPVDMINDSMSKIGERLNDVSLKSTVDFVTTQSVNAAGVTLTDMDISKILSALTINFTNVTEIDGKEMQKENYKYTVTRLGDETRAVKMAMGGY